MVPWCCAVLFVLTFVNVVFILAILDGIANLATMMVNINLEGM